MDKFSHIVRRHKLRTRKPRKTYRRSLDRLADAIADFKHGCSAKDAKDCRSYVYVYLDPRKPGHYKYVCPSGKVVVFKFKPFYIGKGVTHRAWDHLRAAKTSDKSNHKLNTIRLIWTARLEPIIRLTESRMSDYLASAFEVDLIAGIGRRALGEGPLTNETDGGDGTVGRVWSEKSKRLNSESQKGRKFTKLYRQRIGDAQRGRVASQSHRDAISRGNKGKLLGRKQSAEHIAKLTLTRIGRKTSNETKERQRQNCTLAVPIKIDGIRYLSIKGAALIIGMSQKSIRRRLNSDEFPTYKRL